LLFKRLFLLIAINALQLLRIVFLPMLDSKIALYGSPWMYRLEEQEQGRYCAMLSGNLFLAARSEPILEYDKALHSAQTEYGLDWGPFAAIFNKNVTAILAHLCRKFPPLIPASLQQD